MNIWFWIALIISVWTLGYYVAKYASFINYKVYKSNPTIILWWLPGANLLYGILSLIVTFIDGIIIKFIIWVFHPWYESSDEVVNKWKNKLKK